jgi:hypothetical protein
MGASGTAVLVSLALLLAAPCAPLGAFEARTEQRDRALPGCGICYPGGYDLNTVGSVQGRVLDVQLPDEGPARFSLEAEGEHWIVLASPAWHWRKTGLHLRAGDSLVVRGSKTLGSDGVLYLVAQELRPTAAAAVVLRDGRGKPLWGGGHRGGAGPGGDRGPGRGRERGACRP